MRRDGKPEGLRQSMSWLHTWSGLSLGWLLYAIFFTGTLSYFVDEIDDWMRPELHRSVPSVNTADLAMTRMQQLAPGADTWTLDLPDARHTVVEASWRMPGAPPGRQGTQRARIDAGTGEVLQPRDTRGGQFLYRFHFELYAIPGALGRWIVGAATMFMLVAIISGVITHKKIFTDFFTFRPRKGQRSWLDAHNAMAVLALPFHVVITFSGLLLLSSIMPWGAQALYGPEAQRFATAFRTGTLGERASGPPQSPAGKPNEAHAPIEPMLAEAARVWPGRGAAMVTVNDPGTSSAIIDLRARRSSTLVAREASQRLRFDGVKGDVLERSSARTDGWVMALYNTMRSVHVGRFADPVVRWLLFLSGVVGTVMAATGLVLWVVKRRPQRPAGGKTPVGHRFVEVMNVAAIAGLSLATVAYFWGNRLLPYEMAARAPAEIRCFFIVWGLCLVHAALRPYRQAWREQMALAALALALLPVLNWATGGAGLIVTMARGQWSIAGFDVAALFLAFIHGYIAWVLYRSPGRAASEFRSAQATFVSSREDLQP